MNRNYSGGLNCTAGAICGALLMCVSTGWAADVAAKPKEKLPPGVAVTAVAVQPESIQLDNQYAYVQVLITGRLASGEQIDLTRMAEVSGSTDLATVSPTGVVRPKQDGSGQLVWTIAGKRLSVPLKVEHTAGPYAASFVRDVMPSMSKLGCNAGTCHGSLNGKNGFKLSLRGYDPLYDYRALTDDIAGRRFNRAAQIKA